MDFDEKNSTEKGKDMTTILAQSYRMYCISIV